MVQLTRQLPWCRRGSLYNVGNGASSRNSLPVYLANLRTCTHEIDELCICRVALTHGPTLHCSIFIHDTGQTTGKHIWRFWVWESWHWSPTIAVDYPLAASCSQLAPGTPVVTSALMEAWKYIPTCIAPILTLTVDICRTELYITYLTMLPVCIETPKTFLAPSPYFHSDLSLNGSQNENGHW